MTKSDCLPLWEGATSFQVDRFIRPPPKHGWDLIPKPSDGSERIDVFLALLFTKQTTAERISFAEEDALQVVVLDMRFLSALKQQESYELRSSTVCSSGLDRSMNPNKSSFFGSFSPRKRSETV